MNKDPVSSKARLTFARITGCLGAVALLLMVLAHGFLFMMTSRSAIGTNAENAVNAAQNSAGNLSNLMILLNQSLVAQAADARLSGIIAQADPGSVKQEEDRITRAIPSAWLVRLLPENIDVPDETRSPKMGFSDLHMVINAVNETVSPAIHLANSPEAHLAMALRLPSGGGVLHASWPVRILSGALSFKGACGIALRQENIDMLYVGGANCKDQNNPPDGEVAAKGTHWKIAYWNLPEVPLDTGWYLASLLVSLLLTGGATILLIRLEYAALRLDRRRLVKLAHDLLNGNPAGDLSFKFKEIGHIADDISQLKRASRDVKAPQAKPEHHHPLPKVETPKEKPKEKPVETPVEPVAVSKHENRVEVSPTIFRVNDIRGILGETITPDAVYAIGLAIGAEMNERGENFIAGGHDGRLSSPELCKSLCRGLQDSGRTVINIGLIPTPLMYFATHTLNAQSGVIVTGGSNPQNYYGLKIVIGGEALTGLDLQKLRMRIQSGDFVGGAGRTNSYNLLPEYIERVVGDTQLGHPLTVVIDCGNGAASVVAPKLIRSLGCEVIELFCEVDGHFPNHHPNPADRGNLQALIDKVLETHADLGVAFDGDGDRLGVVDSSGKIICPDRQMMVFAADVLSREPGADIIFDVNCTRNLPSQIVKCGGRPILGKSGHAFMQLKLRETGAMLAGEMSGHIYFQERWYGFDDAIYASARMIEILSNTAGTSAEVFAQLPDSLSTPELSVALEEGESIAVLTKLQAFANFEDARIIDIDGLRVDFLEGWGLVRASHTLPALNFRFEADSDKALAHIQKQFRDLVLQVKPGLKLPF